jgi:hypothetical protein
MRRRSGASFVLLALGVAALALIVVELAMGAVGFGRADLADPCTTRAHLSEGGLLGSVDAAVQRFALAGLDGAACSLRTTREELVLSFAPAAGTKKVRWSQSTIRAALRGGLDRAAHEAAGNGFVGDAVAFVLREALADPLAYFLGKLAS